MVPVRLAYGVDRWSWAAGVLGVFVGMVAATLRVGSVPEPAAREVDAPVAASTVEGTMRPGREPELVAVVSEPMTRLDAMPIGDYASLTGPAPWGEATVLTAERDGGARKYSSGEVVLYAQVGATWWSLHLADTGHSFATTADGGFVDALAEVTASGPTFLHDGALEVALDTKFTSAGHTTTWHTTAICKLEATGAPTCTHAVLK